MYRTLNSIHAKALNTCHGVYLPTGNRRPSLPLFAKVSDAALTGGQMFYSLPFPHMQVTIGTFVNTTTTAESHVRRTRHNKRDANARCDQDIVECRGTVHSLW